MIDEIIGEAKRLEHQEHENEKDEGPEERNERFPEDVFVDPDGQSATNKRCD